MMNRTQVKLIRVEPGGSCTRSQTYLSLKSETAPREVAGLTSDRAWPVVGHALSVCWVGLSLEVQTQSSAVVSRPADRRAGKYALECYQVKPVGEVLYVELSRKRNVLVEVKVSAD
jgi:hypothetical protein